MSVFQRRGYLYNYKGILLQEFDTINEFLDYYSDYNYSLGWAHKELRKEMPASIDCLAKDFTEVGKYKVCHYHIYPFTKECWQAEIKFHFLDEYGNLYSPAFLKEELSRQHDVRCRSNSWRYGPHIFRYEPVPGVHHRGRKYRFHRLLMRTMQEERANEELNSLEKEYEVKVKGRRRDLPNPWDDYVRGCWNHKSWKRYRKNRWRENCKN